MSTKVLKLIILLGAVALLSSACSLVNINNSKVDAGKSGSYKSVFFSKNKGRSWQPFNAIPSINGRVLGLDGLGVKVLRSDPEDSRAVYLGSFKKGLYYTYNIKNGWNWVSGLAATTINDVQVSPQNKCLIYAALANSLYRSNDCSRDWSEVYVNANSQVSVKTIAIDQNNPRNLYIGTSQGEIIKSIDGGNSWRTIHTLSRSIAQILISPRNSNLLFVATVNNKVYSFTSNSQTNPADPNNIKQNFSIDNWTDFNPLFANYDLGSHFIKMTISPQNGAIFLATDKVILRSLNNGLSWEKLRLLQSKSDSGAGITSLAINPKNPSDLYYLTRTAFFSSLDGGVTWKTQALPSGRWGQILLVDFYNPNNIYLGTVKNTK